MDLEKIKELREFKKEKEQFSEREKQITSPTVTDISLVKTIYDIFWEILEERDCPPRRGSIMHRKKFFFVIISLYCPSYFIGYKMPRGLRRELASLFGYNSQPNISNLCHNIVDQYVIYKDLRSEVNGIIEQITERLKNEGYI